MRIKSLWAAGASLALISSPAESFGLKTHLWMAQAIHADVANDCHVTLQEGKSFGLEPAICEAIQKHPGASLAGAIGPDAFPDIAMGQTIIHPGNEADGSGWTTADWLRHLLEAASTPEEIAFSAGFLIHAAGDVFAHTYVNNYAGDVFVLQDERLVERRHTLLEKYIDSRLPAFPMGHDGSQMLSVPEAFAAQHLIFGEEAGRQNARAKTAAHLVALRKALEFAAARGAPSSIARRAAQDEFNDAVRSYWSASDRLGQAPGQPTLEATVRRALKRYNRAYGKLRAANEVAAYARLWKESIRGLGSQYIAASLKTTQSLIRGPAAVAPIDLGNGDIAIPADENPLRHYRQWWTCFGPALRGEPIQIGETRCEVMASLETGSDFTALRNRSLLSPATAALLDSYRECRRQITQDAVRAILDIAAGRGWVTCRCARRSTS